MKSRLKKENETMSNNINIADILRDCPKGMKLYSPYYGEIRLDDINMTKKMSIRIKYDDEYPVYAFPDGKYCKDGECCIFPSREMRDWSKFFKRGDVVYNPNSQMFAIFEGWVDDTYTEFNTTHNLYPNDGIGADEVCETECFLIAEDGEKVIKRFEEILGGKYNPDTLHVEPAKPKHVFKPFDKVLVRDTDDNKWKPEFFSSYDENDPHKFIYDVIGCCSYRQCIPYNDKTAHLVGTTDPYEE